MSDSSKPLDSPLHVWIVNQYAQAPDQPGITRNYALAESMLSGRIESLIIAEQTSYMNRSGTHPSAVRRLDASRKVPFLWIPAPRYKGNGIQRVLNTFLFALAGLLLPIYYTRRGRITIPDVVIGSSPSLFAALTGWALARIYRAKYVLEIRDIYPLSITALTNVSMRHPYVRMLGIIEEMLYRRADLIVSPLQGVDDHVRKTIGTSKPWIWIPNSVNCDRVPEPGSVRSAPEPFTFVYAGAHGLANDLQTLVEAASLLTEENFRFILYGDGITKARLIDYVESRGLNNVVFHDPVPKTDIYDRLASADALMFLQTENELYESGLSANKLYDYLAVARPVLIAAKTSHNPIAAARAGITVAPGSATAFADGARRMALLSAHERSAMGARGRAHVREHYDLPTIAGLLATSLHDLS